MINYGYFRHRFDATDDSKLQTLIDDIGLIGVAYYFTLLEIFGKYYSESEDNKVVIHRRVIANKWRKRVDSCDLILTKLQLSGLLVVTKLENTYLIDIPNFSKYYGSYKKTTPEKRLSKEKESKINKSKEKKTNFLKIPKLQEYLNAFGCGQYSVAIDIYPDETNWIEKYTLGYENLCRFSENRLKTEYFGALNKLKKGVDGG